MHRYESPLKSRTRGSAILTNRSRNSYMMSPRNVTLTPIGIPSRNLNEEIAFRALTDNWLLTGNLSEFICCSINDLNISGSFTQTPYSQQSFESGNCHWIGVFLALQIAQPGFHFYNALSAEVLDLLPRSSAGAPLSAAAAFSAPPFFGFFSRWLFFFNFLFFFLFFFCHISPYYLTAEIAEDAE